MRPILLAFLLAASGSTLSATLVYTNGAPDLNSADSRSIAIFRSADDFALGSLTSLTSIRFWMVAQTGEFSGIITYAIYQDSAGSLGTLVDSATVNGIAAVFLNPIPVNIHNMYLVDFNLPAPLALGAGTYWLELHEGVNLTTGDGTNNVLWAMSNAVAGNARQSPIPTIPSFDVDNELAFELYDASPVPEPSTISACALGLVALLILRWRRSAASFALRRAFLPRQARF